MATISHSTAFLIVLLFMASVQGETTCKDIIGDCGHDCNARCSAKYPGGQGVCAIVVDNPSYCTCYYNCGPPAPPPAPPPPKRNCHTVIGDCVSKADCNARCIANKPGGEGWCYPFQPSYCTCDYTCLPTPLPKRI